MRPLLTLLVVLALAACSTRSAPTLPTQQALPTVPLVGEILADAQAGPIKTLGYLFITPAGAALVEGVRLSGPGAPEPLSAGGIWLGAAPLPSEVPPTTVGERSYMLVEAVGRLEGPGNFGPAGRYSYSLAEPHLEGRSARNLTIATLLENRGLYEGQPVGLRGQLLISPDTALLVESLGSGGVPDTSARQVKLAAAPPDPAVLARLRSSANGRVSYGPVALIAIWRGGALYPLAATAEPQQ